MGTNGTCAEAITSSNIYGAASAALFTAMLGLMK
jgi:hypothetical protein